MKLLVIGCKTMREGVVVSAVFLVGGLLLTLAAQHIVPAMLHMNRVVPVPGLRAAASCADRACIDLPADEHARGQT